MILDQQFKRKKPVFKALMSGDEVPAPGSSSETSPFALTKKFVWQPGWKEWPLYLLLAITLGVVYWRTLLPVVGYWGDMAKFDFIGKVLGTPHPSGYPTYVMLNWLFVNLFPKGSLAFRANLLSAIFSILAVCLVYAIFRLMNVRRLVAFVASLTFGLTFSLWSFSLVAEVYTLNILFTAGVIYFLLRWHMIRYDVDFYLACAVYAISFGNHLTMIALLPAFIYMVWTTDRKIFWNPKKIVIVFLFVLIGFAQYGYIVWRTLDPTTPFLETDARRWLFFLSKPTSNSTFQFTLMQLITERIPTFLGYLAREFNLLVLLAIWGMIKLKDRPVNIFLGLCALGNFLFALQFKVREPWVYFLPTYLVITIYWGAGLEDIYRRIFDNPRIRISYLAFIGLVIPLLMLMVNYNIVDQSQHTLHAQIVEKVLSTVKNDAVIIVDEYDYASYFWYYLLGEGYAARGLYSFPIAYARAGGVKAYLEGKQPFDIPPQRLQTPLGLPVYALWTIAEKLEKSGLQLEKTEIKYIYRVVLPGP